MTTDTARTVIIPADESELIELVLACRNEAWDNGVRYARKGPGEGQLQSTAAYATLLMWLATRAEK